MTPFGRVYCMTNLVTGKKYVGQTVRSLVHRWKQHCYAAEHSYDRLPIHAAIAKYGKEVFSMEQLSSATTREELDILEREWILRLGAKSPAGYNLTDGGSGCSGFEPSALARQRMSLAHRGKKLSAEHRAALSVALHGRSKSADAVRKASSSRRGRKATPCQAAAIRSRNSSLTDEIVAEILKDSRSTVAIAKDRGVSQAAIWRIRNGMTWETRCKNRRFQR